MSVWFFGSVFLVPLWLATLCLAPVAIPKHQVLLWVRAGLINAILDPILIFGLGNVPALGIQGAAIASVIAWSVALVIILYILA